MMMMKIRDKRPHQHRILYPVFSSYVTCSVRATCSGSEIAIAVANADGERLPKPPAPVLLPILACSEAREEVESEWRW